MMHFIGCGARLQGGPYTCGEFGLYCSDCLKARITNLEDEIVFLNNYDDEEHASHLPKRNRRQELTEDARKWKRKDKHE